MRRSHSRRTVWNEPDETDAHVKWVKGFWQALRSYSPRGAHVNFSPTKVRIVSASYQGNYDRLVQIKRKYDPANLFRLNQNIRPDAH